MFKLKTFDFNNRDYFRAVAFMLLLTTYLPLIYKNLPSVIGSHHLYAAIWFASLLLFYPKILAQRPIFYLIFYGLVIIFLAFHTLWSEMDDWNKNTITGEYYVFLVAISVVVYFITEKDYEGLAWLTKWSLIFIGITAIMTIYSTTIDPMYVRKIVAGDTDTMEKFNKLGGGGYGYVSALVALFPMLFYYYRNNSSSIFSKKIILLFGILFFFALIRAQIFTNILLSLLVIIISFLGRKKMRQSFLVISFFIIFFYAIPKTIYADLLVSFSSYFDTESNVYYKLNDMAEYLTVGEKYNTGIGERADRYPLLWEAFVENPVLGYAAGEQNKNIGAGGHLYWMNKLTILGILGIIPILLIHFGFIKSAIKLFNKEYSFYFLISVFAVLGLGLMKNLAGRQLWFAYFILLPGMYFLPLLKKESLYTSKSKKVF